MVGLFGKDKYMEETGTLWLLHYRLATNQDYATAWYYFNEFHQSEFRKDDFILSINNYIKMISTGEASESP